MLLPFLVLTVAAALVSALGAVMIIHRAHALGLIDQPGQRRMHRIPTPRGGGIGMVFALLLSLILAASFGFLSPAAALWALAGLSVLALVGFWDDRSNLPVLPRLAAHGLASLLLAWSLLHGDLPVSFIALVALALVFPFAINLSNFLDGLNGILTLQLLVPLLAMCVLLPVDSTLWPLAFAGTAALISFLPFNFPSARCFMGDAASGTIGSFVAWIGCAAMLRGELHPILFLLLNSGMLIDTLLTLSRRALVGKKFWRAHREHLYQWWARAGASVIAVNVRYLAWSAASILYGVLVLRSQPGALQWLLTALWFVLGGVLWRLFRARVLRAVRLGERA
ncbi:glycosyl transferase [Ahniella affigens]|uniref:Glycosyl transferase n=1 Tax=Ahniella affigens TaxID=2021234 RepID=A0A2P1PP51_9GAMM|nr:glycosyl transferase [Ahniella affigens]AVP96623.1 glycosyl transferase [Ahniella affigens]